MKGGGGAFVPVSNIILAFFGIFLPPFHTFFPYCPELCGRILFESAVFIILPPFSLSRLDFSP
jgi:hypothetical protein